MANDELGRIKCDCGKVASVYQAKRKGAHLYSRCPDCGLDQRTGKRVQERLYWLTDWNGGKPPTKPEGVGESRPEWLDDQSKPEPESKPKPEPEKPVAVTDWEPEKPEAVRSARSAELTENKPNGGLKVLAGVLLFALMGGVVWAL